MDSVQFRIARPTTKLKQVVDFYTQALKLPKLGLFSDHANYDGVMIGLPDSKYHLEFTYNPNTTNIPSPTPENLLVFYYLDPEKYKLATDSLSNHGHSPVEPENPYWQDKSLTYEDPDGWRVVLVNGTYQP